MRAKLKLLQSPDIDKLEEFIPDISDEFGFLLRIMVGSDEFDGYESFDVTVCTPKWLVEKYKPSDIIFGIHYIIMFSYNYNRLKEVLKKNIEDLEGNSWDELAQKIAKIGMWEFQDYKD